MAGIERLLKERSVEEPKWSQPDMFKLTEADASEELRHRLLSNWNIQVIDPIQTIAEDLYEMHHPDGKDDTAQKEAFVSDIYRQGAGFGTWVHFPWSNKVVRFADKQDHQELRTFRNRNLFTPEEQRELLLARIAVIGMSVGSAVGEQLVTGGVGSDMLYADRDTLSVPNLNRIRSGMPAVGTTKVDIAARKTSELDPYVRQTHLRDGLTRDSLAQLEAFNPDVVFDEVDDLGAKVVLRRFAAEHRVPLIMATDVGEKSMIDVERYDTQPDTKAFLGRISSADADKLADDQLSAEEKKRLMVKIIGIRNASARLLGSLVEIDKTLGGFPQLGSTAAMGGALAELTAKEIILGRGPKSGRSVLTPRKVINMPQPDPLGERVRTVYGALKRSK